MSILGAILGGAAGLIALGGPLGALLGAAAGHAIGRLSRRKSASGDGATEPGLEGLDARAATKHRSVARISHHRSPAARS